MLLLRGQGDAVLGLIDGMVHCTPFGPAASIHGAGPTRLIICIVVLKVRRISTHPFVGLRLHMLLKLIELLLVMLLLMIPASTRVHTLSGVTCVLSSH